MSHLWMCRPDLEQLPAIRALPGGYELGEANNDADVAQLAETLTSAFQYPWDVDLVRAKLIEAPDVLATYVVRFHGRVVATASSRWLDKRFPTSGYVHWIGTHADHGHRGLASALTIRLLDDFRQRGDTDALLETDDFRTAAIQTYLKFGFVPMYNVAGEDHRLRWSRVLQTLFT